MVLISAPPALTVGGLHAYHTTDPSLSNAPFLVLYGPAATNPSSSVASARIQCHILTSAGFQSFPRLAISPATPLYAAVSCLPKEEQGDEVIRALAYSIYKYFGELPENVKDEWTQQGHRQTGGYERRLYTAQHAADIASRLAPLDNTAQIIRSLESALSAQTVSYLDLDIVLPPGTIRQVSEAERTPNGSNSEEDDLKLRYGTYAPLVTLFGEYTFIPTSKVQRAPSKASSINRSLTFAKKQKESLRRELNEFVDTEESYVEKLGDLVHGVATRFRQAAFDRSANSTSPEPAALESLFPPSADAILKVNADFLDAIRKIVETTEESAIRDIETTADSSAAVHNPAKVDVDLTGATAFAEALLVWYPKFADCYSQYFQAQPKFGRLMRSFTSDPASTFTKRVQETGEQRLMSLLIEPVQRLPRYNLYIDNIVKQLPVRHPSLKLFLQAKDLVAKMCDQDGEESGFAKKLSRVKTIVSSWPSSFRPQGRFITAVDIVEMGALNEVDQQRQDASEMLLLLFAGHLVFVRKLGAHAMSSRSFIAEVDKSSPFLKSETGDPGLLFITSKPLCDFYLSESHDGNIIRLFPARPPLPKTIVSPNDDRIQHFMLVGGSQGRATKFLLDVVKAKVEGRVSEEERESPKWEARMIESGQYDLGLFSSIFEEGNEDVKYGRGRPGSTRIVVDVKRGAKQLKPGEAGVEVVASISVEDQGFYRVEIEAVNERNTRDLVTETELIPVLVKRLANLLQMRNHIRHPLSTIYLLQHHGEILNSLVAAPSPQPERNTITRRAKRPASPVKLLANLFGNVSLKDMDPPKLPIAINLATAPRLGLHQRTQSVPLLQSNKKENQSPTRSTNFRDVEVKDNNSFELLEKTLSCYLLALQARKGNVIGTVVSRRAFADEAVVNKLYNALLESPDDHERAAQAPVDVLFASFEQFVANAWKDRLGPIIKTDMLEDLQARMERLGPLEYDEYEEMRLAELAPQNRRAFASIIATLADLLHGTRNDGDRGALTAAFAEIVVCDANPHDFMSLFDRFVENEEPFSPDTTMTLSVPGSISTHHSKGGSVSSKASSLGRRLGFGSLRRENSKKELGSLLRMGSKKALPEPPSEKPRLSRAQSQDLTAQVNALRRPGSRDQSSTSRPGTGRSEQDKSAPPSIEVTPAKQVGKLRKSRRSSLSDLTNLHTPSASPFWTDSASKQVNGIFEPPSTTLSPSRIGRMETPTKSASVRYHSPPKENIAPLSRWNSTREGSPTRNGLQSHQPPFIAANTFTPLLPPLPTYALPKGPLSERLASGNTPPVCTPTLSPNKHTEAGSPKKLKVQSPAKMRERIQQNQSSITGAQSAMQAEMNKIGLELEELGVKSAASPEKSNQASITNVNTRLKALENRVTHFSKNLTEHSMTLENDLNASLKVALKKAKTLEAELAAANEENDVMFVRMNDEIANVYKRVQQGEALEEMKRLLTASQEEALKWKKEATRLKSENASLRAFVG